LVIPYYGVQQYNFEITKTGETTATMAVSNLFSPYIDGRSLLVEVRQINSNVQNLQSISPLSQVIFRDYSFDTTVMIQQGINVTKDVSNLQQDQWYSWTLIPAYNAVGNAAVGSYILSAPSIIIQNNITFYNSFLDLRAFKICKWNKDDGCVGGIH